MENTLNLIYGGNQNIKYEHQVQGRKFNLTVDGGQ